MKCCNAGAAGGFESPLQAMESGKRESILYIPAVLNRGFGGAAHPDYLATVDVDPLSPGYSTVIHRLQMPVLGDELHHMGWNACSSCYGKEISTHSILVVPGVLSGNVYFIDVKSDPREPRLHKTIYGKEFASKVGAALPHTSHCAPNEIIMSFMGGPKEEGFPSSGNGFVTLDPATLEITGRWERGGAKSSFGYDFWYQPRHNVMISSEWGEPTAFASGFNPDHVCAGKYGHKLYVWDWTTHELIQELELGIGSIPLEVRFLHDPSQAQGFVACALSSEVLRFFKSSSGQWETSTVIKIPSVAVDGWMLPEMPALITDFVISLNDMYLYLACWLHGDVRQYDIRDTSHPRLVGQVYVGGCLKEGFQQVKRKDGKEQVKALKLQGVEIQGGAQMIQLSLDGQRLYVSTSLFSVWDAQFYPDLTKLGGQLLQIDVDTVNGGLSINENFLVDFGSEPYGPALCHEMRFPGGDCTSDIWL